MTEYHYTVYRIGNLVLPDDLKPGEVEIDPITPQQQKAIQAKLLAEIDRQLVKAMTGGYDVEVNSAGQKGVTIEHVRRPRAEFPDSRQESRKGRLGFDRSRTRIGTAEDPGSG